MARGRHRLVGGRGAPPDPIGWVTELGNNYLFIKYTKITQLIVNRVCMYIYRHQPLHQYATKFI